MQNQPANKARVIDQSKKEETWTTTWNVQKAAVRNEGAGRIQRVISTSEERGWTIVMLSEKTARESGAWWANKETVIVHERKNGILLRGEMARSWLEEGQQKWHGERVTAGKGQNLGLVAVYQPLSQKKEEVEEWRRSIAIALKGIKKQAALVIGGDHNA